MNYGGAARAQCEADAADVGPLSTQLSVCCFTEPALSEVKTFISTATTPVLHTRLWKTMNRGQTWAKEEQANERAWLFAVRGAVPHKNQKLRQQYIKIRDALSKTGSSTKVKDKFVWYDALDKILGTKPDVEPVDIVESFEDTETVEPSQSQDTDYQEGEDTEDDANISGQLSP
ncbi:hypothetical protein WMY93_022144 [Mugilogobius chulae]|uniref:MADF domain-containing protein n=1 Tax=Mugilogobius chulae TaxID=88201 RepID=A0AAW0NHB6_9GOBI